MRSKNRRERWFSRNFEKSLARSRETYDFSINRSSIRSRPECFPRFDRSNGSRKSVLVGTRCKNSRIPPRLLIAVVHSVFASGESLNDLKRKTRRAGSFRVSKPSGFPAFEISFRRSTSTEVTSRRFFLSFQLTEIEMIISFLRQCTEFCSGRNERNINVFKKSSRS